MHDVIEQVVDGGALFEIHADFAPNIVVGLARMDGATVGVVREPTRRPCPRSVVCTTNRALPPTFGCL